MWLRQIRVITPRPLLEFHREIEDRSWAICDLIMRTLKRKVQTQGFWGINICPNDKLVRNVSSGGTLDTTACFDFKKFMKLEESEQKERMLKFVIQELKVIFKQQQIDISLLQGAEKFVREKDFVNLERSKRYYLKDSRKIWAQMEYEQDFTETRVFMIIKNEKNKIRELIAKASPDPFRYQVFFRPLTWLSEKTVELKTANDRTYTVLIS